MSSLREHVNAKDLRVAAVQFESGVETHFDLASNVNVNGTADDVIAKIQAMVHKGIGTVVHTNLALALEETRRNILPATDWGLTHLVVLTDGLVGGENSQPDAAAQAHVRQELFDNPVWGTDGAIGEHCGGADCTTRWAIETIGQQVPRPGNSMLDDIATRLPANRGLVPNVGATGTQQIAAAIDALVSSINDAVEFVATCSCPTTTTPLRG